MSETLVTLLPLALVVAVTPVGLLEMILVLFSKRWRVNSAVFLSLIVAGAFLAPLVVALGYSAVSDETADSGPSTAGKVVLFALGALFLLMALKSFRQRHDHSMPKALHAIENMGPGAVAVLAPGVTVVNPKNLALLIAAGQAIGAAGMSFGGTVLAAALFAAVATSLFASVVGLRFFGGPRADAVMERLKAWLIHWNQTISFVLFALLGAIILAKALGVLG
jgi:hypothetical protein